MEQFGEEGEEESSGILGMFKGGDKCLAMEGILKEGEKLMKEDMSPEVSDAAIIAAAQKVEHYEISSYGTAKAYAQELNLNEAEELLQETLDEEYEADDMLTEIAESRVNQKATSENGGSGSSRQAGRTGSRMESSNAGRTHSRSAATAKASSSRGSSSRSNSSKSSSSGRSRNGGGAPSKKASSSSKRSSGRGRSNGRSGSR